MKSKNVIASLIIFSLISCQKFVWDNPYDTINIVDEKVDITTGLIAYYPMNGNVQDSSGSNFNGSISGCIPTTNRKSIVNTAYYFDGIDDKISLPTFPLGTFVNEMSIYMWVFNSPTSDAQTFFIRQGPSSKTWILKYSNKKMIRVYNDNVSYVEISSDYLNDNEWYHLTVTIKSTEACVYINGAKAGCATMTIPYTYTQSATFLGNSSGTGNQSYPYSGKMDDVRIYNRVLTPKEITFLSAK
jgi:hypothetical protein